MIRRIFMNNEKNYSKHIIVFIISSLVLTILMNILVMPQLTKPKVEETNYSFFLDKLEDGEITLVQVKDNQIKFSTNYGFDKKRNSKNGFNKMGFNAKSKSKKGGKGKGKKGGKKR